MASTLRKLFFPAPEPTTPEGGSSNAEGLVEPDSKAPAEAVHPSSSSEQTPDEAAQDGVAQAEAITLVWTKTSLGCAYILQVQTCSSKNNKEQLANGKIQDVVFVLCQRFPVPDHQQRVGLHHQRLRIAFLDSCYRHRVQYYGSSNVHASRENSEPLGPLCWFCTDDWIRNSRLDLECNLL